MANAIVGSAKLLLLASLFGVPIGFLGAIYLAEFSGTGTAFVVRYAADLLNGVPSIVIGIFAYSLAVLPFKHFSTFAGGFALGMMMIPITLRSTEEFLRSVPVSLREGAMALGASKWKTIATVIVPSAYRGILTAVLLAFARVGLGADSGASWTLQRLAGAARAAELLMLAEPLDAERAMAAGLFTAVVPDDEAVVHALFEVAMGR